MPELKPRAKIVARGQQNFTALSTSVDIPLARNMPNTNYKVYTRLISGVGVQLPQVTQQTPAGFRLSVGVGVASVVEYIVIED
jgi:hypothetical protein